MKDIEKETHNHKVSSVYADLRSFTQIKELVFDIYNRFDRLDVLISNAGVYRPKRSITQEGLEETFAVNYIAPFLLTNLLIDLLRNAKSSRIVNVVSRIQSNHFDFKNLQFEEGYTGVKAYARSKTALVMFTYFLADKLKDKEITVNCLHPGVIDTKILRSAFGSYGAPLSEGAKTLIFAATAPELENLTGKYFVNNHSQPSQHITYDKEIQKKLWKKTEEILGMDFN
jgi:NAD(P)-dependent dehydrogenase (short-subunit alcohol dehydrogenase family)